MNNKDFISIGKIINFFGIKGEAKVGFDNENQIKNASKIYLLDDPSKRELKIKSVRFHKNFAIMKFEGINDINDLILYKGQRIFISKKQAIEKLEKDEYSSQDLLNIKNSIGQGSLVPFVNEFFPVVDIKNKKIVIKLIEGLLSWDMML